MEAVKGKTIIMACLVNFEKKKNEISNNGEFDPGSG